MNVTAAVPGHSLDFSVSGPTIRSVAPQRMDLSGLELLTYFWNLHPRDPGSYDELAASRVVRLTKRSNVLCKPSSPPDRSRVQDVFVENDDADAI